MTHSEMKLVDSVGGVVKELGDGLLVLNMSRKAPPSTMAWGKVNLC